MPLRIDRRKLLTSVLIATAVLLVVAAAAAVITVEHQERLWRRRQADKVVRMFGGEEARRMVEKSDRAEAYRLGPLPARIGVDSASLGDYPVTAGPVTVEPGIAAELCHTLASKSPRIAGEGKACSPAFGVRIRILAGEKVFDVLLCFECDILEVYQNGTRLGGGGFELVRPTLVRAVKLIFTNDAQIQGMSEDRSGRRRSR